MHHIWCLNFCCCFSFMIPELCCQLGFDKIRQCINTKKYLTVHIKSPSGPVEIVILENVYISLFAIWVICYSFYGKPELGLLTWATLKQTSLFQDKQRRKPLNIESQNNVFCKLILVL